MQHFTLVYFVVFCLFSNHRRFGTGAWRPRGAWRRTGDQATHTRLGNAQAHERFGDAWALQRRTGAFTMHRRFCDAQALLSTHRCLWRSTGAFGDAQALRATHRLLGQRRSTRYLESPKQGFNSIKEVNCLINILESYRFESKEIIPCAEKRTTYAVHCQVSISGVPHKAFLSINHSIFALIMQYHADAREKGKGQFLVSEMLHSLLTTQWSIDDPNHNFFNPSQQIEQQKVC